MFVISISRGSLRIASKLAEGLKEKLGGKVITREDVIKAAEKYSIHETGIKQDHILRQHVPGFWERYSKAREHYLTCFKAALIDFALEGSIIYHGNLAQLLMKDIPYALRVRVNAPQEDRIKELMKEENVSEEDAKARINTIDTQRKQWTQFLYDVDVQNPILFDMVLNFHKLTVQDAVELVASEVAKKQFQPDEASIKKLKDVHLATVVHTYLMHSPDTYSLDLDIHADSDTGRVIVDKLPSEDRTAIENIVRSVLKEVKEVKSVEMNKRMS